jgi:putative tricarboxylic transport membrane protein
MIQAISTDANPWLFLTRPISGGLIAASVLSIGFAVWQHNRETRRLAAAAEEEIDTDF